MSLRHLRGWVLVLAPVLMGATVEQAAVRVYSDAGHVHVVSADGKDTLVEPKRGQIGIDAIGVAPDHRTAGWLVLFPDPDGGSPVADKLHVWRDGRTVRVFSARQSFWSWSFEAGATQVAYHDGPTHGERLSHCELHDLATGRLLASWDGDLGGANKPAWAARLDH